MALAVAPYIKEGYLCVFTQRRLYIYDVESYDSPVSETLYGAELPAAVTQVIRLIDSGKGTLVKVPQVFNLPIPVVYLT